MFLQKKRRPSLNEIEVVFRTELEPEFAELEKLRKSVLLRLACAGAVVVAILIAVTSFGGFNRNIELIQPIAFLGIMLGTWLSFRARKRFRDSFKERVMTPVCKRFFPELSYASDGQIAKNFYDESELFRKELNTYTGNDLFKGTLGEVDFQFSELLCQYTSGSGKNRQTHTVFKGFFFVGEFHRDIFFRTKIEPDFAENILGVLGRGMQRIISTEAEKLVDLENPEFEKLFKVTSGDQVEARLLLTPVFMEKLVSFRKEVGNNVHLSFANGRMFLAISTNHDYFEPSLFGEILSRKDLMKFIDMLLLMLGVAEEFLHHPKFTAQGKTPPKMPPLPQVAKKGFIPMATSWKK